MPRWRDFGLELQRGSRSFSVGCRSVGTLSEPCRGLLARGESLLSEHRSGMRADEHLAVRQSQAAPGLVR